MIGKFLPLHAGHQHLISTAIADLDAAGGRVDVVVCDRPGERPAAAERARWVEELFPEAAVHLVDDVCAWHGDEDCPPSCSTTWADHLGRHRLGPWTHVHGSEDYITPFAAALDAAPVLVDPSRRRHPIRGRGVRADLASGWDDLDPVVRAGLVRRVVVVGAESTGTTTLARDLAEQLGTAWVPEYGRTYSEERAAEAGSIFDVEWTSDDFDVIAHRQEALERGTIRRWTADAAASRPTRSWGPIVVCDTDLLATAVWHRRYVGGERPDLLDRARCHAPLLYVLTSPDGVPFEQDGLRDGEHVRTAMTDWFREALRAQRAPWVDVSGTPAQRVSAVETWLGEHAGAAIRTASPTTVAD